MTNTETIKALRDALTEIQRFTDSPVIHAIAKRVLALTADASDQAPFDEAMRKARFVYRGMPMAIQALDYLQAVIDNPLPDMEPAARPAPITEQSTSQSDGAPNNVRPAPVAATPAPDLAALYKFYNVATLEELARIQDHHITRLQAKLPKLTDESPRTPREG